MYLSFKNETHQIEEDNFETIDHSTEISLILSRGFFCIIRLTSSSTISLIHVLVFYISVCLKFFL